MGWRGPAVGAPHLSRTVPECSSHLLLCNKSPRNIEANNPVGEEFRRGPVGVTLVCTVISGGTRMASSLSLLGSGLEQMRTGSAGSATWRAYLRPLQHCVLRVNEVLTWPCRSYAAFCDPTLDVSEQRFHCQNSHQPVQIQETLPLVAKKLQLHKICLEKVQPLLV